MIVCCDHPVGRADPDCLVGPCLVFPAGDLVADLDLRIVRRLLLFLPSLGINDLHRRFIELLIEHLTGARHESVVRPPIRDQPSPHDQDHAPDGREEHKRGDREAAATQDDLAARTSAPVGWPASFVSNAVSAASHSRLSDSSPRSKSGMPRPSVIANPFRPSLSAPQADGPSTTSRQREPSASSGQRNLTGRRRYGHRRSWLCCGRAGDREPLLSPLLPLEIRITGNDFPACLLVDEIVGNHVHHPRESRPMLLGDSGHLPEESRQV